MQKIIAKKIKPKAIPKKDMESKQIWNSYESLAHKIQNGSIEEQQEWPTSSEFHPSIKDILERGAENGLKRRSFLTLMGASLAMAGLNCYKKPIEKIVPYLDRPVEHQPGIPIDYASAHISSESVIPILVKTREGKPIKVEGNPDHPILKGGIHSDSLATIWDLYDPDRLRNPLRRKKSRLQKAAWGTILSALKNLPKKKIAILSRPSYSPSEKSIIQKFATRNKADWIVYDPVGNQQEVLEGEAIIRGNAIIPRYQFDKADIILSIEADFLGTWINPELFTKQFSSRRNPDKINMNRLVTAETMMSLTGANSDERISLPSGTHIIFALGLAHLILPESIYRSNRLLKNRLSLYTPEKVARMCNISEETLNNLAYDLLGSKGKSIVVGGGASCRNGESGHLHYVASLLNALLQNDGKTILTQAAHKEKNDISTTKELLGLIANMRKGKIHTLIIDQANPVFDLPASTEFKEALKKVKEVILISTHRNETAEYAHYILSASHFMESWKDGYSYGVYSIAQPLIRTLFQTRSVGDIWLSLNELGEPEDPKRRKKEKNFYHYIKNNISRKYINDNWEDTLSQGYFVKEKPLKETSGRSINWSYLQNISPSLKEKPKRYHLNLYENLQIKDGSGANISFRQELPDPITKVTWGNYAAVSPQDATKEGWKMGDRLKIASKTASVILPVFIQPGVPSGSISAAIGYGHKVLGKVAKNVGQNVWKFAILREEGYISSGIPVDISLEVGKEKIATVQKHHEIPGAEKRGLVNFTSLEEYKKNKKAGHSEFSKLEPGSAKMPGKGLYPEHKYKGYRWGMNIDLTKCTGCSACVTGCYSENNIPAVGKKEVLVGREMSWLRIDRYYHGNPENPEVLFQPVMCQHCENAPCENVCPVAATTHSSEGLNDMTYNRCIGTRYCANNCPYKVRRFNWHENWENKIKDPQQYSLNPDVTVRSRGVIEKCSFCIQRIAEKRQKARLENRKIQDKEIQTACQQACPSEAITFGNINNVRSRVSQEQKKQRSYKVLLHTNVKPSVTYMTKVKNS